MFLLDTHVWIWLFEGYERGLGQRTRRMLDRAARDHHLWISPLSGFEIAFLHGAGRLQLNRSPEQWIRDSLEHARLRVAELSLAPALDAGYISRAQLSDPMDRLLVATARYLDATFVTADRAILKYARGGNVRVHDASK